MKCRISCYSGVDRGASYTSGASKQIMSDVIIEWVVPRDRNPGDPFRFTLIRAFGLPFWTVLFPVTFLSLIFHLWQERSISGVYELLDSLFPVVIGVLVWAALRVARVLFLDWKDRSAYPFASEKVILEGEFIVLKTGRHQRRWNYHEIEVVISASTGPALRRPQRWLAIKRKRKRGAGTFVEIASEVSIVELEEVLTIKGVPVAVEASAKHEDDSHRLHATKSISSS